MLSWPLDAGRGGAAGRAPRDRPGRVRHAGFREGPAVTVGEVDAPIHRTLRLLRRESTTEEEDPVYRTIEDFLTHWTDQSRDARRYFDAMTDASLEQSVAEGHRTLGRIAWHLVTTIPEMMGKTGLPVGSVEEDAPLPESAGTIATAYSAVADELTAAIRERWTDADLLVVDEMYGQRWVREFTLRCLVEHQIHHLGQISVLLRQAGLPVPGVYGPAKEDWAKFGRPAPEV